MSHSNIAISMRRIVTGETGDGRSLIIVDGPPARELGETRASGLHEIWCEDIMQALDPGDCRDLGADGTALSPDVGVLKVRWFVVEPIPEGVAPERVRTAIQRHFREMGAEHELRNQDRHPSMHQTETLDVVCLISGDASLVLDDGETRLSPGQVVIQRGTSHGWTAHDGPALFLAVLVGRKRCAG